jgi:3-dehydroquinate synthetase
MRTDKKATNSINLVLNKAIGKSIFVKDVKPNAIKKMIKKNNV